MFYDVFSSANLCDDFLNKSVLKTDIELIAKKLRNLNSQDLDIQEREKWNYLWALIPKDNYDKKIIELAKLNYDSFLKFQYLRIFSSYSIKKDPEKIYEWLAIDAYLRRLVQTEEDLSLDLIIGINKSLTTPYSGSDRHGRLRAIDYVDDFYRFAPNFNVFLAVDVEKAMEDLLKWYNQNKNIRHPIEIASIFYQRFITIHPFMDGNGRTGALLIGYILLRNGYPPPIYSDLKLAIVMRSLNPENDVIVSVALLNMTEAIKSSIRVLSTFENSSKPR